MLSWTLAIEALSWIELERLNEDAAIRKTVKQLKVKDRSTVDEASELVYETVRRKNSIDYLINQSLEPDNIGNQKIGVRSFLRLFTYFSHYKNSLSDAYQLSEHAVDLLGRREIRKVEEGVDILLSISIPFNDVTDVQRLAYIHFHPVWYVEQLINQFDAVFTEDLLRYVEYPSYIRINTLKAELGLMDSLSSKGVQLARDPVLTNTFKILDNSRVTDLPEYSSGQFIIQDRSSIAVGEVADPKPGELVLDVCAAPGVKTSHLAQLMENEGRILSLDYNLRRLKNWERLMKKLGIEIAKPIHGDASKLDVITTVDADVVVIDPPCTGSGLFHKEPSSKWRLTPRSIGRMSSLQKRITENMAQYVRPGGTLVYSTCSITYEENEGVVSWFLNRNSEFDLVEASPRIGEPGLGGFEYAQRMYPHLQQCNGFFIAKLVKSL